MAKKVTDNSALEAEMFKTLKVDKLYKNSKGDYFTQKNLAELSEKGDAKKVETIEKVKKVVVPEDTDSDTDTDTDKTGDEAGDKTGDENKTDTE